MSNGTTGDWSDSRKKRTAVYKVLKYLAQHQTEALACVGKDDEAAKLFREHGEIEVPAGARVIIFAPGEQALRVGASVVLEVPPANLENASDEQLMPYRIGNYPYWPPN